MSMRWNIPQTLQPLFWSQNVAAIDIFSQKEIPKKLLGNVKERFGVKEVLVNSIDELTIISNLGVKISFISYPFAPFYQPIDFEGLPLASWKDIALDKAYTIGRRGEWRDYIDVYFSIKNGFTLGNIMEEAKKKFGEVFSEKLFLSQLYYLGDIKDFSVELLDEKVTHDGVEEFFKNEIKQLKL